MRLFGDAQPIALVRAESLGGNRSASVASRHVATVAATLRELGVAYTLLGDGDLASMDLSVLRIVVLSQHPRMPPAARAALLKWLRGGGKLLAFGAVPADVLKAAGFAPGEQVAGKPGAFQTVRPAQDAPLAHLPAHVAQPLGGLRTIRAVDARSAVAAEWYNRDGKAIGQPAVLASANGVAVCHALTPDDPPGRRHLVAALLGHVQPELWPAIVRASIDGLGAIGPYASLESLRAAARRAEDGAAVIEELARIDPLVQQARKHLDAEQYGPAMVAVEAARAKVLTAACRLQRPKAPEHRAFWCHSAFGVKGMTWDEAIRTLADNGFTAILPNMSWGGAAFYDSKVLPKAVDMEGKGDQIAECLAACKRHGIECHVWKVNWNMGWRTPKAFMRRMKREGRTQLDAGGKANDRWLCPSHPANRQLEIDAMVEVAERYDVDGIHFDYIRYPNSSACFCDGCRQRFEQHIGRKIKTWPGDVLRDKELHAKWLDWRRSNITAVVAGVAERVRKLPRPVQISAAVFANYRSARDGVGQDWALWCRKGYLDFVCPMDYTASTDAFRGLVRRQLGWAHGVPCYPGIGLSVWGGGDHTFELFDKIQVTRELHAGGFTVFNYDPAAAGRYVPRCGLGVTRKE